MSIDTTIPVSKITYNDEPLTIAGGFELRERDIIGKWAEESDGEIIVLEFKENGICLFNGFECTYTILGNTIQIPLIFEIPDMEPQTITFVFTYNRDADTLVSVGDDGIEYVATRVPTTLITKEITENGTHKASDDGADGYSEVVVNVASSGGSTAKYKSLALFCANRELFESKSNYANSYMVNNLGNTDIATDPSFDTSEVTDMSNMFYNNTIVTTIPQYDTSNVTTMREMFNGCTNLKTLSISDTSKVKDMYWLVKNCTSLTDILQLDTHLVTTAYGMFQGCTNLKKVPQLDFSKAYNLYNLFQNCSKLESVSLINTVATTNNTNMFSGCTSLKTIETVDMRNVTTVSGMFNNCKNLTNLTLKNIKTTGLQIGSGTSYGHLLTVDSLVNTIKELWAYTSGSYTLTIGTANTAKLADVYVKLITPTEEQIANDPFINSKMPCEVCESSDEGAMLITDYATSKRWTIA